MTLSTRGIDLIKRWEGFRPDWYQDVAGVWTIGYGATEMDPHVDRAEIEAPITEGEATEMLLRSLRKTYAPAVEEAVSAELTPHQFTALTSFAYNVGGAAMADSTLVELLNAGREEEAEEEFGRWVHAGGKEVEGLVRRREAERALFEHDEKRAEALTAGLDAEKIPKAPPKRHPTSGLEDHIPSELNAPYGRE